MDGVQEYYSAITQAGGTRFRFHGLRNSFIIVAERQFILPISLMQGTNSQTHAHPRK